MSLFRYICGEYMKKTAKSRYISLTIVTKEPNVKGGTVPVSA